MFSSDSVRRAIRTFVFAWLGLMIPAVLGFMNDVTGWANSHGQGAFPDAHNLSYAAIAALSSAMITAVNLIWNGVEDKTGRGFLRDVPPKA